MPKSAKIYTQAEWDAADLHTRLYMHLVEPHRWALDAIEKQRLDELRIAWDAILNYPSIQSRVRNLEETLSVTDKKARLIMKEAVKVFGDIDAIDVRLELSLSYDRYRLLAKKADEEGDYDTARRCEESADKVAIEIEKRKPKIAKQYATIILSDDPVHIRARNDEDGDNIPEIEFENVETLHLPQLETETLLSGQTTL